jgi:hypothetical protein
LQTSSISVVLELANFLQTQNLQFPRFWDIFFTNKSSNCHKIYKKIKNHKIKWTGGIGELANASVVHPTELSSNLGIDRKYFLILFVWHLNSNV